jgi:hypothetical protein
LNYSFFKQYKLNFILFKFKFISIKIIIIYYYEKPFYNRRK